MQLANQIESLVGNPDINISAPGAAPIITAAAVAGQIQSQAVTQKMLAAMLRQEAARLAHDNAIRKRNAAYAGQLQTDMTNVLNTDERVKAMGYRVTKWLNSARSAGARICRWSGRHAVLLALVLLLSTIIVPRKVGGQLPSPCCAMLAEGLGTITLL